MNWQRVGGRQIHFHVRPLAAFCKDVTKLKRGHANRSRKLCLAHSAGCDSPPTMTPPRVYVTNTTASHETTINTVTHDTTQNTSVTHCEMQSRKNKIVIQLLKGKALCTEDAHLLNSSTLSPPRVS